LKKISEGTVALGALILFALWLLVGLPILYAPQQQHAGRAETAQRIPQSPQSNSGAGSQLHSGNNEKNSKSQEDSVPEWISTFFEIKLTDALIALFTIVLAVKTSGLFKETAGLRAAADQQAIDMRESIAASRKAADAAMLSARAAIGIELPVFRIKPDKLGSGSVLDANDNLIASYEVGSVVIANNGRTQAFPIEMQYGMTYGGALPEKPIYTGADTFLPNYVIEPPPPKPAIPTTPRMHLTDCSVVVPDDAGDKIKSGEICLWFYCNLVYDDFMDTRRSKAVCWRWRYVGAGMAWRPDDTPAYNTKT
jgi:hypothetical protein